MIPTLALTNHPLQRTGALVVARLAGREDPSGVTEADLNSVAVQLADWYSAAAVVPKETDGYGLWKVLFNFFPNSPVTHAKRPRDQAALRGRLLDDLFAPDSVAGSADVLDGAPAGSHWGKDRFPMVDSAKLINLRPGETFEGWPLRRANRIALWALPFGCINHPAKSWLMSTADPDLSAAWIAQIVARNIATFVDMRSPTVPPISRWAELELLEVHSRLPRSATRADATLYGFKNDNQSPELVVVSTRDEALRFHRGLDQTEAAGWQALASAAGTKKTPGAVRVAQALFDSDDPIRPRPSLIELARRQLRTPESVTLPAAIAALLIRHLQEVQNMESAVTTACEHIAGAITAWVADRGTRGRYQEAHRALSRPRDLDDLVRRISHDRVTTSPHLLAIDPVEYRLFRHHPKAWELLTLIHLHVSAGVGEVSAVGDEDDDEPLESSTTGVN